MSLSRTIVSYDIKCLNRAIPRPGKVVLVGRYKFLRRKTVKRERSVARVRNVRKEHEAADHADVGALPQQTRDDYVLQRSPTGPLDVAGVVGEGVNQFLRNVPAHQIARARAVVGKKLARKFFLGDIPRNTLSTL